MKVNKVIEAYRPNMGFIGFYFILQIYVSTSLMVLYIAQTNDLVSLETLKDSFVLLSLNIYMALGFIGIMLLELLLSMFQWFRKKRKEGKK